jgi:hypothetical protein
VPGGQYSVSAALAGYRIVPNGFANPLTIAGNLSGINFSGSAGTVAAVTGRITQLGLPLAGVTVNANQGSSTVGTAISDSDGYYRIYNLANGAYVIAPNLAGYSFSPASQNAGSVPASGVNFSGTGPNAPPAISSLSANPSVVPGRAATTVLAVAASGSGTLTYSWDAVSAAGPVTYSANDSSSASSTTASFLAAGNYTFRARVTDGNGLPTTATVGVTVSAGPGTMVVTPYEVQLGGGQTARFQADAWDQLGNPIAVSPAWSAGVGGSIDSTGLFTATTAGGPYPVIAVAGSLSATGFVWVTSASTNMIAPVITTQPVSQTVPAGSNATFTVTATGTTPFSYQWFLGTNPITGATASNYTRADAQPADAGNYSVQVTNLAGSVTSSNAMLTVVQPPVITTQPISLAVAAGSNVVFTVVAAGTGPLSYQWQFGSSPIQGATANTYTRMNAQSADAGIYTVVVTNTAGSVTSSNAVLTVNDAPVLAPINNQVAHAGSTVIVTNTATDLEAPPEILTFSLDPGFPAGAAIGAASGVFTWTTSAAQAGTTNPVTVRVTDNGAPPLSDAKSFVIAVVAPLSVTSIVATNATVTLTWGAIPGTTYRVQFKGDLGQTSWSALTPDATATNVTASASDSIGLTQRFYRITVP